MDVVLTMFLGKPPVTCSRKWFLKFLQQFFLAKNKLYIKPTIKYIFC